MQACASLLASGSLKAPLLSLCLAQQSISPALFLYTVAERKLKEQKEKERKEAEKRKKFRDQAVFGGGSHQSEPPFSNAGIVAACPHGVRQQPLPLPLPA